MIEKIKQFFCKHQYSWYVEAPKSGFRNISGETRYLVCDKCGKVKSSYFAEYEGGGFK